METLSKKQELTKTTATPIFPQRDPKVATVLMLYRDEFQRREKQNNGKSSILNGQRHEIIQRAISRNPAVQRRAQMDARGPARDFASPTFELPIQRQAGLAATISGYRSYLQSKAQDQQAAHSDPIVQAKLQVSKPNDPAEIEADSVSEQIMRMPDTSVYGNKAKNLIQRHSKNSVSRQEANTLFRAENQATNAKPATNDNLESKIKNLSGKGESLPEKIKTNLEGKFGHSFDKVRVHTNGESQGMAQSINAKAFTSGNNIVFGEGQYNTESSEGKKLLAHELTHTVQQGASVKRKTAQQAEEKDGGKLSTLNREINDFAKNIPGYNLLIMVLGRNPITGQQVQKSDNAYVQAFLGLIPGGELIFSKLNETGAIDLALNWLRSEVKRINLSWPVVKEQLKKVWNNVQIWKAWKWGDYANAFVNVLKTPAKKLVQLGKKLKVKAKELMLRGALNMAGPFGQEIFKVLNRGNNTLAVIVNHPTLFIGNFFEAVKNSFLTFKQNFGSFFKTSVFEWMFGALQGADITIPNKLNLAGIFSVTAQVLGLTYQAIRQRAVKGLGKAVGEEKAEKAVSLAEKSVSFVITLFKQGPLGFWEEIKDKLSNIKELVMGPVLNWVRNTIIFRAIEKLITMLIPGAGLVAAVMSLYRAIKFFMDNIGRIKTMVLGIFSSVSRVAAGNIAGASKLIVGVMAKGMTFLVRFLANFLRLGGIGKAIQKAISKIRQPIDKALDFVIGKIIKVSKGFLSKIKGGGNAVVGGIVSWWKSRTHFKAKDGSDHELYFTGSKSNPKLMVASNTPKLVEAFLKKQPKNKAVTSAGNVLKDIFVAVNTLRSLNDKTAAGRNSIKKENNRLKVHLGKLSFALEQLLAEDMDIPDPPTNINPTMKNDKAWKVMATGLHQKQKRTGSPPHAEPLGWNDKELVGLRRKWVRMHLISEKIGGPGDIWNLVPGPQTINVEMNSFFENPIKSTLGRTKKEFDFKQNTPLVEKKYPVVMWVSAMASYYQDDPRWVERIKLNAGMHFFNSDQNKWLRDKNSLFQKEFAMPKPRTVSSINWSLESGTRYQLRELNLAPTESMKGGKSKIEPDNLRDATTPTVFDVIEDMRKAGVKKSNAADYEKFSEQLTKVRSKHSPGKLKLINELFEDMYNEDRVK